MLVVQLEDCPEFIAGDKTVLREVLHPDKVPVAVRYSLAHATVRPGERSLPHRLRTSEVYYVLKGSGLIARIVAVLDPLLSDLGLTMRVAHPSSVLADDLPLYSWPGPDGR